MKDSVYGGWGGFKFERLGHCKTYKVLKRFLDSGFSLRFVETHRNLLRRRNVTKLIKSPVKTSLVVDMESQIQAVFFLAFALLLVCNRSVLY